MITLTDVTNPALRIQVLRGDLTTIRIHGELDLDCLGMVKSATALVPAQAVVVTVDLAHVTSLDRAGADALAALHAAQRMRGRGVRLVNARPLVRCLCAVFGTKSLLKASPSGVGQPPPGYSEVGRLRTTRLPLAASDLRTSHLEG